MFHLELDEVTRQGAHTKANELANSLQLQTTSELDGCSVRSMISSRAAPDEDSRSGEAEERGIQTRAEGQADKCRSAPITRCR